MKIINHAFTAVTPNMYKRADKRFHPLLELAIMLNQLFSNTYFADLTLLMHLVAISLNVNAKDLKDEAEENIRKRLVRLEDLRNIFFFQVFNWFRFKKLRMQQENTVTLDRAIQMLESYAIGCRHHA